MEFSPVILTVIGLLLAAWTVGAATLMVRASRQARRSTALQTSLRRMQTMLEVAPAIPILVRVDGRIEAPDRLARWLGLEKMPAFLSELDGGEGQGLSQDQLAELSEAVRRTQKSASPFQLVLTPPGSERSLALRGALADPQVSPGGAALVWVFDFSESEGELSRLRLTASRAEGDFAALVGLIEAAPSPMWFRGAGLKLQLVNQAYVEAVGAENAEAVIEGQIELFETVDGRSPIDIARTSLHDQKKTERQVAATIAGERRTMQVSDLPLGREGVAGYAIDIEQQEQQARELRAFRDAQRAMLDQISIGVAQFDAEERLTFANRPFRRQFSLVEDSVSGRTFEGLLSDAREAGRTPEVRDFPEWRREHADWFGAQETQEEAWPLPGGTHLRVIAQPMPDGGLVLIAEDQTEQLALSATRDTLLRTRTATLDSLFEALAIFSPDGSVQLWNRSFAGTWGLDSEFLDTHPNAESLLEAISKNLARPSQARSIGAVVRAATLDRKEKGGRVELTDGRTLEFAGVPLPDGNGLLSVLDITDAQKAENALRERNLALEEADAVKARFLANMSYEFRTPLTSIGGFAELIKSGAAGDVSEQMTEYVDAIIDSVARLTEQVENVLDLSQSEAGLLPITKQELDLMPFVTKLVREREKAIVDAELGLDLRGKRGTKVQADPRQLGKAIGQLLDNAISGTPADGKILINIAAGSTGAGSGEIAISDNGHGMSKTELARAMDSARVQDDGSLERREGLGIPLARQLVEAHGGRLDIMSEEGVGTTATIHLP
ncbi:MAG: PAS-domain containing protein [Erythrobacter sp.]